MDAIDKVKAQLKKEMPDLDTTATGIFGRLIRISKHLETKIADHHKPYGLKPGEFDVLATLRRSGKPYQMTPSELLDSLLLTSGAMTNRLDKLASKGLITRTHSEEDRRSVTIALTPEGQKLAEEMLTSVHKMYNESLGFLTNKQTEQIDTLLKIMLEKVE